MISIVGIMAIIICGIIFIIIPSYLYYLVRRRERDRVIYITLED